MNKRKIQLFAISAIAAATLVACGGDNPAAVSVAPSEVTPSSLTLEKIGGTSTGIFDESAAEIATFDPSTNRLFVSNASTRAIDVFDFADPENPVLLQSLPANDVLTGATVNSVAVANGILAVAIEASPKTNLGRVALYRSSTLELLSSPTVGAMPDMVVFTPDGNTVLSANEGEPSDDYQIDPEGSVSIIDVRNPTMPVVRTASFGAFTGQEQALRESGIRIYGPGASASQDFEPEYIAVTEDGKTAFVSLQENNAIAKIDIATANVLSVLPMGFKDHGVEGNELDVSDRDDTIDIRTWPGVLGMYMPDSIATYAVNGKNYIVTANEGDARAWGENNQAYFDGNANLGFVEEFRVRAMTNTNGWASRVGDDLPPQLDALVPNQGADIGGALLNPMVFGYCGAIATSPGACRDEAMLGRLNISWTMGYRTNADGTPVLFNTQGVEDPAGTRIMYDNLYAYGGRSFSIFDEDGTLVFDSGAQFEKFLASDECMAGSNRDIPCKDFFNTGHDEGDALDSRSDAKGSEPEGIVLGKIGEKTFAFIGLERMGGVFVYDITDPEAPEMVDYLNTRDNFLLDPEAANLAQVGDLGPEGLTFIKASDSPNGEPLLVVTSEVSGTTAVMRLNLVE
ncbi:choice-of-anchor I family protein [Limnobacter parvus]|uniref:Choice-of-anchor I family protein n=1 Tax=Limnobacter parvus TaxID=2939690 RepID=A0ABT1XJX6_9BURK|nr:choice-of-anchor I family protein [Limnobacter parvus]MCR2747595.1 choice-of-anchor I family protein [Limnobacter parvus]